MDKSTDTLYETSLKKPDDIPDAVHLTHMTTPQSVYQLRVGFAGLASNPLTSTWYLWLMWPVTLWSMILTWIHGRTFIIERNTFKKLKAQSWAVPRYRIHVSFFTTLQLQDICIFIRNTLNYVYFLSCCKQNILIFSVFVWGCSIFYSGNALLLTS